MVSEVDIDSCSLSFVIHCYSFSRLLWHIFPFTVYFFKTAHTQPITEDEITKTLFILNKDLSTPLIYICSTVYKMAKILTKIFIAVIFPHVYTVRSQNDRFQCTVKR